MGDKPIERGDILEGVVLEVKEGAAVVKFYNRAIEVRLLADLEEGENIKLRVKGWHKGELLLRVLGKDKEDKSRVIDIRV